MNTSTYLHLSPDYLAKITSPLDQLHVLPIRFMKIRYYGFPANMCKKKSTLLIRRLIGIYMETQFFIEETTREKVLRLTGRDILICPACKQGRMVLTCSLPGLNSS